jgi:tetratricopeptide (TPR) repeat protein
LLALTATEQIYTKRIDERLALAEEAVALARTTRDTAVLAHVFIHACRGIGGPSTLPQRLAWSTEALQLANDLGDPVLQGLIHTLLADSALESADRAGFEDHNKARAEILETLPDASLRWSSAYARATQALLDGDLARAEEMATHALNLGIEVGQHDALVIYGAQLLNVRIRQGRLAEVLPLVEDAITARPNLGVYRAVLAFGCADTGDLDRCRQVLAAEAAAGFPIPEDTNWTTSHQYWSESAVLGGDRAAAEVLLHRITPFVDRMVTTNVTVSPALAHTMGRLQHFLGQLDASDESYRRALQLHEGIRSPLYVSTTQAAWAGLLVDRDAGDDAVRARSMAEEARSTASERGYRNVERDASAVLARLTGVRRLD